MRVITGSQRGRVLTTLEGDGVRPTPSKVKEALFSAIHFEIENKTVLDLFSGSGQLGIEALSRGAAFAVFTDSSVKSVEIINKNISVCGFKDCSEVIKTDFRSFLDTVKRKFDIVFIDPPYMSGFYEDALSKADKITNDGAIVTAEHPKEILLSDSYGALKKVKDYNFGTVTVSLYRK